MTLTSHPWTYEIVTPNASEKDVQRRQHVHQPSRLSEPDYALKPYPDLTFDRHETYGNLDAMVDRCFAAFKDDGEGTLGILSVGKPGSGKTTFLKVLSQRAREELSLPTVMINQPFHGPKFNAFIHALPAMVVAADEFTQTYNYGLQGKLLTLYSGVDTSPPDRKKMIVHTTNSEQQIHPAFLNRPGRLFYKFKHGGVDSDFIRSYCQDNLNDIYQVSSIVSLAKNYSFFSFDMLRALVSEMNRHGESPHKAIQYLNIEPMTDSLYRVSIFVQQKEVDKKRIQSEKVMESQLLNGDLKIAWMKEDMTGLENMVEIDPRSDQFSGAGGDYVYEDPEKYVQIFFSKERRTEIDHVSAEDEDLETRKTYSGRPRHDIPF